MSLLWATFWRAFSRLRFIASLFFALLARYSGSSLLKKNQSSCIKNNSTPILRKDLTLFVLFLSFGMIDKKVCDCAVSLSSLRSLSEIWPTEIFWCKKKQFSLGCLWVWGKNLVIDKSKHQWPNIDKLAVGGMLDILYAYVRNKIPHSHITSHTNIVLDSSSKQNICL